MAQNEEDRSFTLLQINKALKQGSLVQSIIHSFTLLQINKALKRFLHSYQVSLSFTLLQINKALKPDDNSEPIKFVLHYYKLTKLSNTVNYE